MLHKEYQMRIGGKMKLSDEELRVNATLMKFKAKELDAGRRNITDFPPAVHFFRAKALIDKSDVFKIIRNMPKGRCMTYVVKSCLWSLKVCINHASAAPASTNHAPAILAPHRDWCFFFD